MVVVVLFVVVFRVVGLGFLVVVVFFLVVVRLVVVFTFFFYVLPNIGILIMNSYPAAKSGGPRASS